MKHRLALLICMAGGSIMASSAILVSAAEAQRGGRGGGSRGGGGGASRGGGGGSYGARSSRPSTGPGVSSSARGNINRGTTANRNTNVNRNNVNRNNVNRNNINTGNINTGDINIDNDWDGGCCRAGAGFVAGAAVASAVAVGAYYSTLPGNCASIYRASMPYYQCGSAWYQPVYSGSNVTYVVVNEP